MVLYRNIYTSAPIMVMYKIRSDAHKQYHYKYTIHEYKKVYKFVINCL